MITTGLIDPEHTVPFVIEHHSSNGRTESGLLTSWYQDNQELVEQKLLKHGAILFRGFDGDSATRFEQFTRHRRTQQMQ